MSEPITKQEFEAHKETESKMIVGEKYHLYHQMSHDDYCKDKVTYVGHDFINSSVRFEKITPDDSSVILKPWGNIYTDKYYCVRID
jgi:hypothetical protein